MKNVRHMSWHGGFKKFALPFIAKRKIIPNFNLVKNYRKVTLGFKEIELLVCLQSLAWKIGKPKKIT